MNRPPLGTAARRGVPNRMGTANRMGSRMGTARLGTAVRLGSDGQPLAPVGLTTVVATNTAERPVTQQGMMGVSPSTGGPGRQLRDRTYYLGELRVKVTEITEEINRLRAEAEKRERDGHAYEALSKRQAALAAEVAQLRGSLSDLNLMVEKVRTEATAESLTADFDRVKAENARMLKHVDRIFTVKKAREGACVTVEESISSHYQEAELQLQDLSDEQRSTYYELQALNKQYIAEITKQQDELKTINDNLKVMEDELSHDPIKMRTIALRDRKQALERERDSIQASLRGRLSAPEEKEKLLAQVKEDNAEIDFMNKQLSEIKSAIAEYKEELEQGQNDLQQRGDKFDKYKVLLERDKEMQVFIDSFPEAHREETEKGNSHRSKIVELLGKLSKLEERRRHMPSASQVSDMRSALEFKTTQKEQSVSTNTKLQQELEERQAELEKMASLDKKIVQEQETLEKRMAEMRDEMSTLQDTEGLRQRSEEQKKDYTKEKGLLKARIETLKGEVYQLQLKQEQTKADLASNETASSLDALEARIRTYANAGFGLREYCETKGKEANYVEFKGEVLNVCDEVNQLISESVQKGYC